MKIETMEQLDEAIASGAVFQRAEIHVWLNIDVLQFKLGEVMQLICSGKLRTKPEPETITLYEVTSGFGSPPWVLLQNMGHDYTGRKGTLTIIEDES